MSVAAQVLEGRAKGGMDPKGDGLGEVMRHAGRVFDGMSEAKLPRALLDVLSRHQGILVEQIAAAMGDHVLDVAQKAPRAAAEIGPRVAATPGKPAVVATRVAAVEPAPAHPSTGGPRSGGPRGGLTR